MSTSSTRLLSSNRELKNYNTESISTTRLRITLQATGWRRFINGISNRYDDTYPDVLYNIITENEFKRIMDSLHDRIVSHWPCDTCFIFGVACAPISLGSSLLCPGYCATLAEKEAKQFLHDVSLSKKYYEKEIFFSLQKTCCSSWIEITIPTNLLKDLSFAEDGGGGHVADKRR